MESRSDEGDFISHGKFLPKKCGNAGIEYAFESSWRVLASFTVRGGGVYVQRFARKHHCVGELFQKLKSVKCSHPTCHVLSNVYTSFPALPHFWPGMKSRIK